MKGQKRLERLCPRLRETYNAMKALEDKLGAPPVVREIVEYLGLTEDEVSRVHGDMLELVDLGLVEELDIPSRKYTARDGPPTDQIDWEALLLFE